MGCWRACAGLGGRLLTGPGSWFGYSGPGTQSGGTWGHVAAPPEWLLGSSSKVWVGHLRCQPHGRGFPGCTPMGTPGCPSSSSPVFLVRRFPGASGRVRGRLGAADPAPTPPCLPPCWGESCICAGPNWGPRLLVPRGQRGPENTTGCPVHSLRLQRAAAFPIGKCRFLVYDVEANCRRWGGESANVVFKLCFGVGSLARNKPSSPSPTPWCA